MKKIDYIIVAINQKSIAKREKREGRNPSSSSFSPFVRTGIVNLVYNTRMSGVDVTLSIKDKTSYRKLRPIDHPVVVEFNGNLNMIIGNLDGVNGTPSLKFQDNYGNYVSLAYSHNYGNLVYFDADLGQINISIADDKDVHYDYLEDRYIILNIKRNTDGDIELGLVNVNTDQNYFKIISFNKFPAYIAS